MQILGQIFKYFFLIMVAILEFLLEVFLSVVKAIKESLDKH